VKKKLLLMCAAGILVMATAVGGTLADFSTSTENKGIAAITVSTLGIEMEGFDTVIDDAGNMLLEGISVLPGTEVTLQESSVVNSVEGGYELYTRMTIHKKWNNNKLDGSKIHLYSMDGGQRTELVAGARIKNWIVWHADEEQVILYYALPLAAGERCTSIVDAIGFDDSISNAYAGAEVELSFGADAVQAVAAKDAMPSEWGVYPVFAEDGTIIAIEE